jgi:hypothetical protein
LATAPRPAQRFATFKQVRIVVLLGLLLIFSVTTCQDRFRTTRWNVPLYVGLYPIAADDSAAVHAYLASLDAERFQPIDRFFTREAQRYGMTIDNPIKTRLRPELTERPPERPVGAGVLGTALFSLKLRYFAWRVSGHIHDPEDIRIFVLFHDPKRTPTVPHSLGLTKGLIGVVYAFADPEMNGANNVVIAHELLHTLGATDKYDPATDAPSYPAGYGDPREMPLYPQRTAELMAGRRMLSATRWVQAEDLDEVVVGPTTALEIRWPVKTD